MSRKPDYPEMLQVYKELMLGFDRVVTGDLGEQPPQVQRAIRTAAELVAARRNEAAAVDQAAVKRAERAQRRAERERDAAQKEIARLQKRVTKLQRAVRYVEEIDIGMLVRRRVSSEDMEPVVQA